jgi:CBS domain-containing protein
MLEMDRNTLPVVDSEIVGYISYTDILRAVKRIEAIPVAEDSFDPKKFLV